MGPSLRLYDRWTKRHLHPLRRKLWSQEWSWLDSLHPDGLVSGYCPHQCVDVTLSWCTHLRFHMQILQAVCPSTSWWMLSMSARLFLFQVCSFGPLRPDCFCWSPWSVASWDHRYQQRLVGGSFLPSKMRHCHADPWWNQSLCIDSRYHASSRLSFRWFCRTLVSCIWQQDRMSLQ